ncbi:MAG: hypothetical protein RMJ66_05240, partial [Bacteroidia bacterium]|nr:hypothetical protein [Bacteroidia bacterium]MDW8134452.1 hypothetical protein [Bacteroidia bacterium]
LRWYLDYGYQQFYRIGLARLYEPLHEHVPWSRGKGWISLSPGTLRAFRVVAEDFGGNKAEVMLTLRGEISPPTPIPRRPMLPKARWSIEDGYLLAQLPLRTPKGDTVSPYSPMRLSGVIFDTLWSLQGEAIPTFLHACVFPGHETEIVLMRGCTLRIFRETLQETLYCKFKPVQVPWGKGFLIGDPLVAVRFPAELIWDIPPDLGSSTKTYPIFRPASGGAWSPIIGSRRNGEKWHIPVRNWGEYGLMRDTFPPRIKPLRPAGPYYLVLIEDLGSGVDPYTLKVRGEKRSLFPEYYEPQRLLYLPKREGHRFWIKVADRVGNHVTKEVRF